MDFEPSSCQSAGLFRVMPCHHYATVGGYPTPPTSVGTINVNHDLGIYGGLLFGANESEQTQILEGKAKRLYFRAVDSAGQPTAKILPSMRWAHLPYHLSGEFSYLAPGCLTTDAFAQQLNGSEASWVTRCQNIRGDISMVEHGLNDVLTGLSGTSSTSPLLA